MLATLVQDYIMKITKQILKEIIDEELRDYVRGQSQSPEVEVPGGGVRTVKGVKKSIVENLEDAISYILSNVVSGDTVLLSPGTSSFYTYSDYTERGEHFKTLVKKHANQ